MSCLTWPTVPLSSKSWGWSTRGHVKEPGTWQASCCDAYHTHSQAVQPSAWPSEDCFSLKTALHLLWVHPTFSFDPPAFLDRPDHHWMCPQTADPSVFSRQLHIYLQITGQVGGEVLDLKGTLELPKVAASGDGCHSSSSLVGHQVAAQAGIPPSSGTLWAVLRSYSGSSRASPLGRAILVCLHTQQL